MSIRVSKKLIRHSENVISAEGGIIACDTETTGLNFRREDKPFAFSFTDYAGNDSYIRFPVDPYTRKVKYDTSSDRYQSLKRFYSDETTVKVFHNAKFDMGMLKSIGIEVKGKVLDTIIFAHVNNSNMQMGLKPLGKLLFDFSDSDQKELKDSVKRARSIGKKRGYKLAAETAADYFLGDPDMCKLYAVQDTQRTMYLYWYFEVKYKEDPEYAALVDMEHKMLWVSQRMEDRGIGIDFKKCLELSDYYDEVKNEMLGRMKDLGYSSLNINSPKQLGEVFYDQLGLSPIYRKRKTVSGSKLTQTTDSKALDTWAREGVELAECIVAYREADQQVKTFLKTFFSEGMDDANGHFTIHPNYKTCGPVTGRISCMKPNLMNISNPGTKNSNVEQRVRECFVPRGEDTVLYFVDYDQVEIWIAMFLSKDRRGMKQLLAGDDLHGDMAKKIWGGQYNMDNETIFKKWRKRAKFCLFGLIYGAGASAIQDTAGCSKTEAEYIRDTFWKTYPDLYKYSKSLAAEAENEGFVTNKYGRKYQIDSGHEYKALNYIVQGTAAEVMKRALINIDNKLKMRQAKRFPVKAKLLLSIHDETCVEAHKDDLSVPRLIVKAMQGDMHKVVGIPQPFSAGVDIVTTNWAEKKEFKWLD